MLISFYDRQVKKKETWRYNIDTLLYEKAEEAKVRNIVKLQRRRWKQAPWNNNNNKELKLEKKEDE